MASTCRRLCGRIEDPTTAGFVISTSTLIGNGRTGLPVSSMPRITRLRSESHSSTLSRTMASEDTSRTGRAELLQMSPRSGPRTSESKIGASAFIR